MKINFIFYKDILNYKLTPLMLVFGQRLPALLPMLPYFDTDSNMNGKKPHSASKTYKEINLSFSEHYYIDLFFITRTPGKLLLDIPFLTTSWKKSLFSVKQPFLLSGRFSFKAPSGYFGPTFFPG